jgi:signal transduction histidine kinase
LITQFLLGIILILALTLITFFLMMSPPLNEIGLMAGFLSITAVISGLAGFAAYRLGWMNRSPTIRLALLGGYGLASLLTFINVWLTARLMFVSQHDLLLGTVLLLFAGGMAMALGYIFANALTDRIKLLDRAARQIAEGDLNVRLPAEGRDELSALALTFNQMAAQLQNAAAKQEQLETLRRDLIAWVGHDLQTPLTSISAVIEALNDGIVEEPQMIRRYLKTARKDVQALSLLIDDLFQMAQVDAGGLQLNREYVSLSDLISDTIESFSARASSQNVTLQGSAAQGIGSVWLDPQRISRVLNNLIDNAIRHTPAGGMVNIQAIKDGNDVVVEVFDTGEGIKTEHLPHLFDRFYRGEKSRSRSTGGSGLGLAIVKGIVEAHGGKIAVESQPGYTRISFNLPIQD